MEDKSLTKRQKRELRREQKDRKKEQLRMRRKIRKAVAWIFSVLVVVFVGYQLVHRNINNTPSPEVAGEAIEVKDNERVRGNSEASVVLVEYSDYQCPACAFYNSYVEKVLSEMGDSVKFVYRHFPLTAIHKNSYLASQAAEAAGKQDKYWEMHDLLFEKQDEWSEDKEVKGKLTDYAKKIGLDLDRFIKDFDSDEVKNKIDQDIASADQLKINSTPTFFLNNEKLQGIKSYEDFKSRIENKIGE